MARMLRDWTDSERIHSLSAEAERFFTRLIMKADDYGRYHGDLKLLRAYLFPLYQRLKDEKVNSWLQECINAGLINHYEVGSKKYVEIKMFDQKLKVRRSKYPPSNEEDRLALQAGYVYIIGKDYKGPVKIGFSVNPWSRLKEITTNHHDDLEILLTIKADKKLESSIHKALKEFRVKNEWFVLSPAVIDRLILFSKDSTDRELFLRDLRSYSSLLRSTPELEREEELEEEVEREREPAPDLSTSNLYRKPKIPTKEQVWEVFSKSGGTKEMAKSFWDKHESTGWFINGSPIINYTSLAQRFITNWKANDEKKPGKERDLPVHMQTTGGPKLPKL